MRALSPRVVFAALAVFFAEPVAAQSSDEEDLLQMYGD
jgi:hypothetical protein